MHLSDNFLMQQMAANKFNSHAKLPSRKALIMDWLGAILASLWTGVGSFYFF